MCKLFCDIFLFVVNVLVYLLKLFVSNIGPAGSSPIMASIPEIIFMNLLPKEFDYSFSTLL